MLCYVFPTHTLASHTPTHKNLDTKFSPIRDLYTENAPMRYRTSAAS